MPPDSRAVGVQDGRVPVRGPGGRAARRGGAIGSLALVSTFALSILIVGPGGDFPLGDDWSFATTARTLAHELRWLPHGWTSMPLVTHSLWAAIPCALTTCSFEILRYTTLAAALLLTLAAYFLFRHLAASAAVAAVAALTTCWNPITYVLSYTFMTDVLFELLLVASASACVLFIGRRSRFYLGASALLLVVTVLCRQVGLCLGIALGLVFWLTSRERSARTLIEGFLPLAVAIAALTAFEQLIRTAGVMPDAYLRPVEMITSSSWDVLLSRVFDNALMCVLYIGLFTLPLGLIATEARTWRFREPPFLIASTLTLAVIAALIRRETLMPAGYNIIHRKGLGPVTLVDLYTGGMGNLPDLPAFFWMLVTAAAVAGTWIFAYHAARLGAHVLARRITFDRPAVAALFGLLAMAAYVVPLLPLFFFDRYIAVMTPLCCLVLLFAAPAQPSAPARVAAAAAVAGLAAVSILGTHDYLSWNRARWQAIRYAETTLAIKPQHLDGGFEYNGLKSYDPLAEWWPRRDARYQITFGPLPDSEVVERFRFRSYIRGGTRYIYLVRRADRAF